MDAKFFRKSATEDEFEIRIDYDGTWYHQGRPIERQKLAKLFSTALHYNPDTSEYWLITPVEQGRIKVADAPYIVIDYEWDGSSLTLKTNLEHQIQPSPKHPIYVLNDTPYCVTYNNVPARINRAVREKLINIALSQDGYDDVSNHLILKANGYEHVIAKS